jgi:hypothetical protein
MVGTARRRLLDHSVVAVIALSACGILLVESCASGTPTQPTSSVAVFSIRSETDAAVIGVPLRLRATVETAGTTQDVPATWSVTDLDVADVSSNGVLTGRKSGAVTVSAAYGDYRTTRELRVVERYSGTWRGNLQVERCVRTSGAGSSYCRFILNQDIPLEFTVTQSDQKVSGSISFFDTVGTLLTAGPVEGSVTDSGNLELTGTARSVSSSGQNETSRIEEFRAHSLATGSIAGSFVRHRSFTNAFGPQVSREDCTFSVKQVSP